MGDMRNAYIILIKKAGVTDRLGVLDVKGEQYRMIEKSRNTY
jgi:hypothetical protein